MSAKKLVTTPKSLSEVIDDLRVKQVESWRAGKPLLVEELLAGQPDVELDETSAIDLIYGEFVIQQELGREPDPADYLTRFPQFEQPLRRQFEVMVALDSEANKDVAASPTSPHTIGRFEIRSIIGRGGFGTVYLAHDAQLDRDVALKVPHAHLMTSDHRERFLREARATAQLQHPNLVAVYDYGVAENDTYFIAYRFIDGATLSDRLADGLFSFQEAALLLKKTASAVHEAHAHGVIHRDLKSTNILVDSRNEPFVSDFGLAFLEDDATLTLETTVLGTPAYMSPEQAVGDSHQADARSDVYSLGVVLYELLTGELPFKGTAANIQRQVLDEEPKPPSSIRSKIPRELEIICLTAMAKQADQRYPTAQHLVDDLNAWLLGEPIQAEPPNWRVRLAKWIRRRPGRAALIAVSVFAAMAVIVASSLFRALSLEQQQRALVAQQEQTVRSQREAALGVLLLSQHNTQGLLDLVEARRITDNLPTLKASASLLWSGWHHYLANRIVQTVGHDNAVAVSQFNSDGSRLITVDKSGQMALWNARTGELIRKFKQNININLERRGWIAVTPNNEFIASIGKTTRMWNCSDGTEKQWQLQHAVRVHGTWLSRSGKWLGVCAGTELEVWHVPSGKLRFRLSSDDPEVCQFTADDKLVAVGTGNGKVRVWEVETGVPRTPWLKHGRPEQYDLRVHGIAFDPAGKWIVSVSRDDTARIWSTTDGQPIGQPMLHHEDIHAVDVRADGKQIATACFSGTAHLWDPQTGKEVSPPLRHDGPVIYVKYAPAGNRLATTSFDGTARVWDSRNGQPVGWPRRHQDVVRDISFSPDGQTIVTGSSDRTARIWRAEPLRRVRTLAGHKHRVWTLAFSPDGSYLATGSEDGRIIVYQSKTWQARRLTEPNRSRPVTKLAISPDGKSIATSGGGDEVRIVDAATGQTNVVKMPELFRVFVVQYSPDGKWLFAAGHGKSGGEVVVTSQSGKEEIRRFAHHKDFISTFRLSANARYAVTGSVDTTAKIWDVETGKQVGATMKHQGWVEAAAFAASGDVLATASRDRTIRLWDAKTGKPIDAPFRQHSIVQCLQFHPRIDNLLAATYADGSVQLWETSSGLPCAPRFTHQTFATGIAFSHDGSRIASASFDRTVKVFETPINILQLDDIQRRTELTLGARVSENGSILTVPWKRWQKLRKK